MMPATRSAKQPPRFRIAARTILELGSELISSDIIAFYELIKNGFDAGTRNGIEVRFNVVLRRNSYLTLGARAESGTTELGGLKSAALEALNSDAPEESLSLAKQLIDESVDIGGFQRALDTVYSSNTVVVSDTGSGMSMSELVDNFLVIGTASRKREVERALARGEIKSPFLGEKGIGRLSAMRLGNRLRIETARRADPIMNVLEIDWSAFDDLDAMLDEIHVEPSEGGDKPSSNWSGTRMIVSDLTEDWTEKRVRAMAEYEFARLTDPFLDQKSRPRIVLYWNGQRISIPWMSRELLSHAHASVSGEYEIVDGIPLLRCRLEAIDLGFAHPREVELALVPLEDLESLLIGTSRQLHSSALLSLGPFSFEAYWYNRRRLNRIEGIGDMRAVRDLQERWSGILLFRDGFRVFPYGDDEDDWLALDRRALRRRGYTLNKTQFIGRVQISRAANPDLVDQTNREGLRETSEQQALLGIMRYVVQDLLFPFMKNVEKQYKGQKVDLSEAKLEVERLEGRVRIALKRLRKLAPKEAEDAIEDLQQALFEFSDFAERARQRIEEVEKESRQMIDMAGVGLMVEVVAHELARASENALENLEALRGKAVPEDVSVRLESLRAQMKSLSKRVRVLDPLSVAGRQRTELFNLDDLIRETVDAHELQFQRDRIQVHLDLPKNSVQVSAVRGMIVQVIENLLSNSRYWLEMRTLKDGKSFTPKISISLHDRPPTIIYEDNGPGIAQGNREKVFRVFFSLKEKAKRRGLGLFIARECAEFNGGSLVLDDHVNPDTGRLHRFILELPGSSSRR